MTKQVITGILLLVLGAVLTALGGWVLSNQSTKDLKTHLANPIPDVLYLDLNFKSKSNTYFDAEVLSKVYEKTNNSKNDDGLKSLHLSIFLDEVEFKNNPQLDKNFNVLPEFIKKLKQIEVMGYIKSTKNNSILDFRNKGNVLSTSKDNIDEYGSIEVKSYNKKTKEIDYSLRNTQMHLNSTSGTQSLLDFDNGVLNLIIVAPKEIKINSVSDIIIKNKLSKYFQVTDIKIHEIGKITGRLEYINK